MTPGIAGTDSRLAASFHLLSKICSAAVGALGVLVLAGWLLDITLLTSVHPSFARMSPKAALLFIVLGVGLWFAGRSSPARIRRACALVVLLAAAFTVVQYVLRLDVSNDRLLFRESTSASALLGRMPPATALKFLLLGLALLSLDTETRRRWSDLAVLLAAAISFLSFCGYVYGAPALYLAGPYVSTALYTALGFLAASLAFFTARPGEGRTSLLASETAAGTLLRRTLPLIIAVPMVLGWLRLRGQEAGLYDTAFGTAILVAFNICLLTAAVSLIASSLHTTERQRNHAEAVVAASEQRLRQIVEGSPYAVAMLDRKMNYLHVSGRWVSDFHLGLTPEAMRGRNHYDVFPDLPAHWKDIHRRCLAGEVERSAGEAFRRQDGTVTWLRWEVRPWTADGGDIGGILIFSEDISAQKRAEESLQQSEARKAAILHSALDAIVTIDHAGAIVEFNPAAERLFGYSSAEIRGKQMAELLVPDSMRQAHNAGFARYLETGEGPILGQRLELPALRADGSEIPIELTVTRVEGQSPPLFTGFMRDVSERKQSAEQFRLAIEAAPTGMLLIDRAGTIVMANSHIEKLFGYSRDELLGRPVDVLVPERFRNGHPEHGHGFFHVPKSRPMVAGRELYGLRKDGTEVAIEVGLNPLQTPEGRFVLSSVVDVTERKRSAEQFRLAIEASPTGMIMVDEDGRIVLVNAQIERLFGYWREELIGKPVEILVPERFRPRHPAYRKGFFHESGSRPMGAGRDLYGLRKDGVEVPIEIGLNPLRTPEGNYVLSSVVDIAERRRAEREREDLMGQLRVLNAELEERVRGRTSELTAALKEREILLQEIHHRVKNNLQVISSLINMQVRKLDEPETRDELEECQSRVQAIALIHEKLYQSKNYARVPFSEYVRSLAGNIFAATGTSPSNVSLEIDIDSIALAVDRAIPCGLILNELITNALKHAFPGDRTGVVRVELKKMNSELLLLAVSDDGVGISTELDPELSNSLGMQLVATLVEQLDGELEIARDHGTTFRITFPADVPQSSDMTPSVR